MNSYKSNFSIRIIKAGFIATPKTLEKAPKLLCITPKKLAKKLLINPNKRGIEYMPGWWLFIMIIIRLSPKLVKSKL